MFSLYKMSNFGPDRNAEGVAIGFGCVVCLCVCVSVCLNFFGNSEFLSNEVQS